MTRFGDDDKSFWVGPGVGASGLRVFALLAIDC
jgi:hypothetical protein